MHTKEMQELTEFQVKITMIGNDIPKKVILTEIWLIFGHSLVEILSKIGPLKFLIFQQYPLYYPPLQLATGE